MPTMKQAMTVSILKMPEYCVKVNTLSSGCATSGQLQCRVSDPADIIGRASAVIERMAVGAWFRSQNSPPPWSEFQVW